MITFLEGQILQEDQPVGPLDTARENLEIFADNLIMQDSLVKMIDWLLTLQAILDDESISELERLQTEEEISLIEKAWSALADTFYENGISA